MLDKHERVEQLRKLGFNVPRLLRIPAGTVLDEAWLRLMNDVRAGDATITIRSYDPVDELRRNNLPRLIDKPVRDGFRLAQQLAPRFNVLWQEAVPVRGTRYCGNVIIEPGGHGHVEAAHGEYEVRQVNDLEVPEADRISLTLQEALEHTDSDLRVLGSTAVRAAHQLRLNKPIILEFNIQTRPVGVLQQRLIFWEWRPIESSKKRLRQRQLPVIVERRTPVTIGCGERLGDDPTGITTGSIGSKGDHLFRMAEHGLPVPPAVLIPISLCDDIARAGTLPLGVTRAIDSLRTHLESARGVPVLWSIRSSPTVSLPGLLHTVLNVGITPSLLGELVRIVGEDVAGDLVREFLISYAGAATGRSESDIDSTLQARLGVAVDAARLFNSGVDALRDLGLQVPLVADAQVEQSVVNVIRNAAHTFQTTTDLGGAACGVVVQMMVFGNLNAASGTGVLHSRNPSYPDRNPVIEFLPRAQGPAIVAGRSNPLHNVDLPGGARLTIELYALASQAERLFGSMQELEFTIEDGRVWLLQSRRGVPSPAAGVAIAYSLMQQQIITDEAAVALIAEYELDDIKPYRVLHGTHLLATGVGAAAGVAVGRLVLDPFATGDDRILIVNRVADAAHALESVAGLISVHGATTAHGAVLARSLGVPAIVAVPHCDARDDHALFGETIVHCGEWITIDGTDGNIYLGVQESERIPAHGLSATVIRWFERVKPAEASGRQLSFPGMNAQSQ